MNTLTHHGIKGQKWGVRRYQNEDGTRTAAGKRREKSRGSEEMHEDSRKAHSGQSAKSMSDAELRARINRLQMEKQYNDLSLADRNRGEYYVKNSVKAAGKAVAISGTAIALYSNADKILKILSKATAAGS